MRTTTPRNDSFSDNVEEKFETKPSFECPEHNNKRTKSQSSDDKCALRTRNWDTQLFSDIEEEDEIESIVLKSDARFASSFRTESRKGDSDQSMGKVWVWEEK
ncbi:hypothetical protein DdX_16122 [Ditylenchus destructor]|uniref:Uncharacterized protein n=1 Tax=Ditylenchus destructor TaxID=166010 RepID=A0AAD4MQX5_9BILA|nr:hypothetical protein DdX_16122 [Ditylenchus destructor]